jgi:membrane protease YdiL (CAAX protease family)
MRLDTEYKWHPRDAWLCFAAIQALELTAAFAVYILSREYPSTFRLGSPQAAFVVTLCGLLIAMGVTVAFARVSSVENFLQAFRLDAPPSAFGTWGFFFGIALALVGLYFARLGWIHDTALTRHFRFASPGLRILLPIAFLVGPFLEEPIMRGFLYPAFRSSYPAITSMVIIAAMSLTMHPETLSRPGIFTILIITLSCGLCVLREKSNNLWDCIVCHLAYNGVLAFADIVRIGGQS